MIDEFSLLKLNPDAASTRQKIIDLLSSEWPLNAKGIHERLQRAYSSEISYHGVHKTLQEMIEERIVEKNKEGYLLSIDWIQKSRKSLEQVEKRYLENSKIKIPEDFQNSILLEFDSFTEISVSIAELLFSRQLARDSSDSTFYYAFEYGWWTFKFRFEHLKLLWDLCKVNPKPKGIIKKITPFGKWIAKQYSFVSSVDVPIGASIDFEEDILVQENFIIEIRFDKETRKIIEHYYQKWTNLTDLFKEFGIKDEPKIHATMRITKNPEMAKYLKKQIIKVFEEANKKVRHYALP